jgi:hypothetical protein
MRTAHRTSGTRERLPVAGNRHEVADHSPVRRAGRRGGCPLRIKPVLARLGPLGRLPETGRAPPRPACGGPEIFWGTLPITELVSPFGETGEGCGGPPAVAPRSPHLADGTKVDVDSAHVPPCRGGENGGEARAPYAQGGLEDRAAAPARVARRVAPQQGNERDGVRAVGRARGRPWLSSWPVRGRTHVRTHTPPTGGQQGPSATHVITRGTGDGGRPATPIPP